MMAKLYIRTHSPPPMPPHALTTALARRQRTLYAFFLLPGALLAA